ncbi:MAG: FAD-dependent oxidoreductase [Balneolaceae bacterium]|nr:FAD-dependent oxidoreductase [Balneolaceae bacterium]
MQSNFSFQTFIWGFILLITISDSSYSQNYNTHQNLRTDLLIAGGGASGVSAAIQAARSDLDVIIVEPTPWLGGMLTAAGVSATDGNHNLPSGIWGEFRQELRDYYGGPEALSTGWVSNTHFEPHVGNEILNKMLDQYPNIRRFHGYSVQKVFLEKNRVTGAAFVSDSGKILNIEATISIDATEYGDLMAMSGADYFIGLDPRDRTGEEIAPTYGNSMIQDLTYTAILKDYGAGADMTIRRPPNYQPSIFENACKEVSENPDEFEGVDCETMLDYAKLPNDKYLINWPNNGNDYYLNVIENTPAEREILLEEAKNRTRQFIYFIQTEIGFKNLGIADDEFDTEDHFPHIAYHRESRRLNGLTMLTMNELIDPYEAETGLYKTAIGVGDYPLDHHRRLNPSPTESLLEEGDREPFEFETHFGAFPPIPSFSVPLGSLIPKEVDGMIVAEKSISVSSIANGSSRLQPVVMTIGQAAGAAAALSVKQEIQPRDLSVRGVQQQLLDSDAWLLPFMDTTPGDRHFEPLQRLGVSGVLKGEGIPYAWANQTKIYPDSLMTISQVEEALSIASDGSQEIDLESDEERLATRDEVVLTVWRLAGSPEPTDEIEFNDISRDDRSYKAWQYAFQEGWTSDWIEGMQPEPQKIIQRKEFAALVDKALNPFENIPVSIIPEEYPEKR